MTDREKGIAFIDKVLAHFDSNPGVYGIYVWEVWKRPEGCEIVYTYLTYEPDHVVCVANGRDGLSLAYLDRVGDTAHLFATFYMTWEEAMQSAWDTVRDVVVKSRPVCASHNHTNPRNPPIWACPSCFDTIKE